MKISTPMSAFAAFFGLALAAHATTAITLAPASGSVSGVAGGTVGWGFTLSNPSDFAVVTSSAFCLGSSGVTTLCEAPTIGTYSDYIASNFVIAGPSPESPVVTQAFSAADGTGVGSFTISAGIAVNATDSGQLVLTYDLYSVDPLSSTFDPVGDLISAGNFLEAPASVTVAAISTPEPKPGLLAGLAGIGAFLMVLRRKSGSI